MSAINQAGLVEKPYPVKDSLFFKIQGSEESMERVHARRRRSLPDASVPWLRRPTFRT